MKNTTNKILKYTKIKVYLVLLLLLSCNVGLLAMTDDSQQENKRLSISKEQISIKELFSFIEQNSTYIFVKEVDPAVLDQKIKVDFKNEFISKILDKALVQAGLKHQIVGRQITINQRTIAQSTSDKGKTSLIKGRIKDVNGEALIGVSVIEDGKKNGTITDLDGRFELSIQGSTIVCSYIGFQNARVTVNSETFQEIILKDISKELDEVVVVGYGVEKKANLTGAVAQVSSDVLANRPIVSAAQGLQGVVPNLNIDLKSGAPGQSASFNIRGNTSLSKDKDQGETQPLILVDNVQMDLDLVNPDDIASISILKDAASAAIYGARGAYGVILVTTKSGAKNEKPRITFSALGYWQSPSKKIETLNSMEYLNMIDYAYQNTGGSGHYFNTAIYEHAQKYFDDPKNNSPVFYDPSIDQNKYQYAGNTNWWDEIYKKSSFSQQYNIGVTGGGNNSTYYVSMGYNQVDGMLKEGNDQYKKFNTNINVSTDITKWLTVSGRAMYNYTIETHPAGGVSAANSQAYAGIKPYSGYLKNDLSPLMPVRHPDGNFAGQGGYTNPIAIQAQGGNLNQKRNDVWVTGAARITPFENFTINTDYTFNFNNKGQKTHVRKFYDYTAVAGSEQYYPWTNPNSVAMGNNEDYYSSFNIYADYILKLNGGHALKAMVGYNQEYKHTKYFYAARQDLIDNNNASINLATGEKYMGGDESHWSVNGFFARLNYNFKDKYLLELNGRYDGSSKFPKGDRYAFFPSVSAAWRVSQESFWESLDMTWWDDLKLRVSYGSLGNQAVATNFPYFLNYGTGATSYMLGGKLPIGVTPPGLVHSSFTWETVNQIDLGLDAVFLNNRLTTSFDWYRRDTKDMLLRGQTLPAVLGIAPPNENAADMKTLGFEIAVGWNDRLSSGFSYWVKAVLSDYQTTVTKFANSTGNLNEHYKGKKLGEIWGYRSNGLFQSDEEVANSPNQSALGSGWGAGDVKYLDLDDSGDIDWGDNTLDNPGDKRIIGNNTPRYSYGISGGFEYKGFDFSMLWQGIGKRDYMLGGAHFWGFTSQWDVPLKEALDYWTPENREAYYPRPTWTNGGNRQTTDRYLQDASYIRLKNLSVGYTLSPKVTQKIGIAKLRIFLVGDNLLTITDLHKSYDPETLDNLVYPMPRKYSIGFNLAF